MIERHYLQTITKRINEPRRFIQAILGPRQVGKTTLISQLLSSVSIPFMNESADAMATGNTAWIAQTWETARMKLILS